jgi:hypothetical protein
MVRVGDDGDCLTGEVVDTFTLEGIGTAAINRGLPLAAGTYKICTEDNTLVGEMVEVELSGEDKCRIMIPASTFIVSQGEESVVLENIKVEADLAGTYLLSPLFRRDENQEPLEDGVPASLVLPPPEVSVTGDSVPYSGTFDLSALNPQPVGGENYWMNVIIEAKHETEETVVCEAGFDYEILLAPNDCQADTNYDCKVNLTDLVTMKGEFLRNDCSRGNPCQADCNDDDKVNLTDLVVMKSEFLRNDCCD